MPALSPASVICDDVCTARSRSLGLEPQQLWAGVDWAAVDAAMSAYVASMKPTQEEIERARRMAVIERLNRRAARREPRFLSSDDPYAGCAIYEGAELISDPEGNVLEVPA